ncbi:MAG: beta-galactosidase [bacterium]|nr:beta-galactosidase [bacterium]
MFHIFFDNHQTVRPKVLGTTFSQLQCKYLKLDYLECLKSLCALPFDVIRISAYWDEIETHPNSFDYSVLDTIFQQISNTNLKIILCLGIKVPRWPEFHIPKYLREKYDINKKNQTIDNYDEITQKSSDFLKQTILRYKNNPQLKYFLIENEGLNNAEFTKGRHLSYGFIRSQVNLVNLLKLPTQRVMCTNAIDLLPPWSKDGDYIKQSTQLADAVGINVYNKVPASDNVYIEPSIFYWHKLNSWKNYIRSQGREVWITESQAEPWEKYNGKGTVVHTKNIHNPSSSPESAIALSSRLVRIGFDNILLWGCEHWYYHKKNNRSWWWDMIQSYAKKNDINQL